MAFYCIDVLFIRDYTADDMMLNHFLISYSKLDELIELY